MNGRNCRAPPETKLEEARHLVARLRNATEPIAVSIGVSAGRPADTADELIASADAQMYRVKAERKRGPPATTVPRPEADSSVRR